MNFTTSTHNQKWLFSRKDLEKKRREAFGASAARVKETWKLENGGKDVDDWEPIQPEEELSLQKYYQETVQDICRKRLHLPIKVTCTAMMLLKRFGLRTTLMEHDAVKLMLTSIYVACKVEESYLNVEQLCVRLEMKAYKNAVLENEVQLLQAVDFDMVIYNPIRPLDGLFADLTRLLGESNAGLSDALKILDAGCLPACQSAALGAAEALMLSDAPLLFSPGMMALAALLHGVKRKAQIPKEAQESVVDALIKHFMAQAAENQDGAISLAHSEQVKLQLADIDALGVQGASKISADESHVKALDGKLRKCRSPLLDPKSKVSLQAKEERKKSKAERKASKSAMAVSDQAGSGLTGGSQGQSPTVHSSKRMKPNDSNGGD